MKEAFQNNIPCGMVILSCRTSLVYSRLREPNSDNFTSCMSVKKTYNIVPLLKTKVQNLNGSIE